MTANTRARLRTLKNETLAGITVSFAMAPEVVAFAFVAGVNPIVGLYAAFTAGLVTALIGGRPGMITGGAGSLAVVSTALVATYGAPYLFAAVVVMGGIQALIGVFRWGRFIRLVPHPVMLGFVNGLAIVIFLAQLRQFRGLSGAGLAMMVGLTVLTLVITALLPRLTKAVPSSLAAILFVTAFVHGLGLRTRTVSDLASVHGAFPHWSLPAVPLTAATLWLVLPYAMVLAGVGLTESLLTQTLVDEMTGTRTSHDRECVGQGLGNIVTGFCGGMGGCAMIAQSILNIESGGRGRLSGVVEACCILAFVVAASGLIGLVPMAALVGVMFLVVYKTFAWSSLRILHRIPRGDAAVLVLVSVVTVLANLATAVLIGVVVSALKFAWETGTRLTARKFEENGSRVYELHGPVFFGSARVFGELFDPTSDPVHTVADFQFSRLHDHSALEAVRVLAGRYQAVGKTLSVRHLSADCRRMLDNAGAAFDKSLIRG
ncbi:sodium-independent anion transporter [Capsulimonas corticalis]|uniref:Sodium-independent anion transporter n=1 Tax=Capsulimonas corticalis TaxID=2219043 RepID=A0A402CVM5_9BACT|nr:SulP family inorganic anion transporter [Capsulimonas corticalis]BDI30492.1 sodium-independent anion transporter [Capsulimonas corticalis]